MPDVLGSVWGKPIANIADKTPIADAVAARARAGDVIGAGSGSTSFLTVKSLGARVAAEGLRITVVPTSIEIAWACEAFGVPIEYSVPARIDWCFDGADEIDPQQRMIKGRGGAMFRERMVFDATQHRIVVADQSKSVAVLGTRVAIPVETEIAWTRRAIEVIAQLPQVESVSLRMGVAKDGPVLTEAGCAIIDAKFSRVSGDLEAALLAVPGVKCTGLFAGYAFERVLG